MFSPAGYTSIRDIHCRVEMLENNDIDSDSFHQSLVDLQRIFVADHQGNVTKISADVLAIYFDEYAFIGMPSWVLSLERVRQAARRISDGDLSLGMYIMRPDKDLGDEHGLSLGIPSDLPELLLPFEGCALCLTDADAEEVIKRLDRPQPPQKRNLSPEGSGRKEFINFIQSFPDRLPKEKEWAPWCSNNLRGGRASGRRLWKELKHLRLDELRQKNDSE